MKTRLHCGYAALCLILQLSAHDVYGQRSISVAIDPLLAKSDAGDLMVWMSYGMRMSNYLNETGRAASLGGFYEPSFEAELEGREFQVRIWREVTQKKPQRSVYMDDLLRVSDAGFMREYVWHYYRRAAWNEVPPNLRLQEFLAWARDRLASHVPYTGARLEFKD